MCLLKKQLEGHINLEDPNSMIQGTALPLASKPWPSPGSGKFEQQINKCTMQCIVYIYIYCVYYNQTGLFKAVSVFTSRAIIYVQ